MASSSFTGVASIHIIEATGLRPVACPGGKTLTIMDPYVVVDFNNIFFGRTVAKKQTVNPIWGETLTESVTDAQMMQFTLFHNSLIPPDNFIAHAQIYVSEMMQLNQQGHEEHEVLYYKCVLGACLDCISFINVYWVHVWIVSLLVLGSYQLKCGS